MEQYCCASAAAPRWLGRRIPDAIAYYSTPLIGRHPFGVVDVYDRYLAASQGTSAMPCSCNIRASLRTCAGAGAGLPNDKALVVGEPWLLAALSGAGLFCGGGPTPSVAIRTAEKPDHLTSPMPGGVSCPFEASPGNPL
jgi:hypothetical protein